MKIFKKNAGWLALFLAIVFCISVLYKPHTLKAFFYPYFKNVQYQWILFKTRDYDEIETEHFKIRYHANDNIAKLVAEAAEENYSAVCKMFDYYPEQKTTVIVYDNAEQMMKNINLSKEKPPMGAYLASTIQILSPELWISDKENMRNIFLKEGPMVHEFTHLLVDDLAKNNYPLWLTEGIALYQEYIQTGYEWGKNLPYPEETYTIAQLTNEFHKLDESLAYKRSFEIVKAIVEDKGFESLNQLIRALGEGKSLRQASIQVLGAPIEAFYE